MATSMISGSVVQAASPSPPPLTGAETAFQGMANVVVGNAQIVQTPTLDTITVSTAKTIINFTPFDTANGGGPITFLPAGRTGLFQNDPNSGVTNFTVINRIIPTDTTRAIRFDGTVQSRIASATAGSAPGGTILFYSPGGIIASSSALFDVGSLVLSAADISFREGSNSFSFSGAAPGATVDINSGASILAQGVGSYVALVAPRIIQSGSVKSDGSIGYVAAEAVDVTIQNNLFDISFVTGTDGGAAVTHTGTTELTRAPDDTSPQRIYVAAVPKNEAITTLVSGSLGYSAATEASVRNGAVILSAGRNVSDSGYGTNFIDFAASTAPANITIGSETSTIFNASVITNATGDALIAPAAGTTVQFNNNVTLNADRLAEVRAVANSRAIFDADLSVTSNNLLSGAAARVIALGDAGYGDVGYGSNAGAINVGGALLVDGGPSLQTDTLQKSSAELIADLGHISVVGTTHISAADDAIENGTANAFGGNALVRVGAAGSQLTLGNAIVSAKAVAGTALGQNEVPIDGNATGGSARIETAGGNLTAGNISVDSDALGRPGGITTAGSTAFTANGGTTHVGSVSLSAKAAIDNGNDAPPAPTAPMSEKAPNVSANNLGSQTITGGTIQLDVINATVNINGDLILSAEANGSEGLGGLRGGAIGINLDNGNLRVGDGISASASAEETASTIGVAPAVVRGGTIMAAVANNGELLASAMNFDANAASGGDASGGMVSLTTNNGGRIRSIGTLAIGAASTVRGLESAGDAVGGTLLVNINSGALESGPLVLDSSAVGGDAIVGGDGGSATGGTARVNISGGDNVIESFSLTTDATGGRGGNGDQSVNHGGAGGIATAGTSEVNIMGGAVRTAGLVITSSATGGAGGDAALGGAGGAATGGRAAILTAEAATLILTKVPTDPAPTPLASSVDSSARGGAGGFGQSMAGGAGGIATGGVSIFTLADADIAPDSPRFAVDLTVNSEAAGGRGGLSNVADGGNGGSAAGGSATLNLVNNAVDFGRVALSTRGSGGSGGSGGNSGYGSLPTGGIGGDASAGAAAVTIAAPAANLIATNIANLAITAEAVGGSGGVGGNGGAGGNAINNGTASFTHTSGMVTIPVAILTTNSFAGSGGLGLGGNGGAGGNSSSGISRLTADGAATKLSINVTGVTSTARGGFGGDAQANPGTRGGNAGNAIGGTAEILAINGATASLVLNASTDASAFGGQGGIGLTGGGSGGNATAGNSRIDGTDGKLDAALLSLSSDAQGGVGGQAGYGGIADATVTGGNGGSGTGGIATLANVRFNSVDAGADITAFGEGGVGGRGPSGGNGGNGNGGSSSFISSNQNNTLGTIFVASEATGGFGADGTGALGSVGGSGGTATSGTATISISGGLLTAGSATARANATGGNGGFGFLAGKGGNAIGGTTQFSTLAGAAANISTLELTSGSDGGIGASAANGPQDAMTPAEAAGGTGGSGGNGNGGIALLTSNGATTSLTVGELITESTGAGGRGGRGGAGGITVGSVAGAGGDGGAGGIGAGGSITVAINGGTAQINGGSKGGPVTIATGGFGALGGNGGEGGVPGVNGANGNALGGNGSITISGAQLSTPNIRFDSDARGASNATGGNATFNLANGATFVGNSLVMTANAVVEGVRRDMVAPVTVGSNAVSPSASSAIGGTVSVGVDNATALLTGTLDVSANAEAQLGTAQGGSVNILANGGTFTTPSTSITANGSSFVAGTEIGGRGGTINIRAERAANGTAGVLNLGSTALEASGFSTLIDDPEAMTNAAAGRIAIAAIGGQTTATNFSTLSANTLGRNSSGFNPNTGIFFTADRGAIIANSAASLLSDESITISAMGTGNLFAGNDLNAEALNMINVDHVGRSTNANTILTASVNLIAGNDFAAMAGTRIRSDNDLNITSRLGGVSAHDLVAGDDIAIIAHGGVNITGLAQTTGMTAGSGESDIIIDAGAGVTIANANAQSSLVVRGASIGGTDLIAGEDIALRSSGDITVTSGSAGDDIDVTTSGGSITFGDVTTSGLGADNRRASFDSGIIAFGAETFARSNILANALTGISVTSANARDTLGLRTDGSISASMLIAGEDATFASSGSTTITTVRAGDDIDLNAAGAVTVLGATSTGNGADDRRVFLPAGSAFFTGENLARSNIIAFSATAVTLGSSPTAMTPDISAAASLAIRSNGTVSGSNIAAAEDIALSASGNISVATALAGDDFSALSNSGNITLTGIATKATGLDDRTVNFGYGGIGFTPTAPNGSRIDANAGYGDINLGTLNSAGATSLTASGDIIGIDGLIPGNVSAGGLLTATADRILLNNLTSRMDSVMLSARLINSGDGSAAIDFIANNNNNADGIVQLFSIQAGRDIALTSGNNVGVITLNADRNIDIAAGTVTPTGLVFFQNGSTTAGNNITVDAFNIEGFGDVLRAGNDATFTARGSIGGSGLSVIAGRDILANAADTVALSGDAGDDIDVVADTGSVSGAFMTTGTAADMTGSNITLTSGSSTDATISSAFDTLRITAGTDIFGQSLTAGDDVILRATGSATILTGVGAPTVPSIVAGANIDVNIGGNLTFETLNSGLQTSLITGGDVGSVGAANSITAGTDVIIDAGGFARVNSIVAGTNVSSTSDEETVFGTVNAGNDITISATTNLDFNMATAGRTITLASSGAAFGTATAGQDIIANFGMNGLMGTTLDAGDDIAVTSVGDVNVTTATADDAINITSENTIRFATLSSGGATSLMAGESVLGGTATAGGALSVMATGGMIDVDSLTSQFDSITASSSLIDITNATASFDVNILTKPSEDAKVMLGTVVAGRDISVTGGAGLITATTLTAGDDINVVGAGTVSITNALTTGSFNSGYGSDPSNITLTAASDAMLGTIRAKDNLTVTSVDGTTATMLTADRGAVLVNGGASANITNAMATLGSVTINADVVDAVTVNAGTDVSVNFGTNAMLGAVTAGQDIGITGDGDATIDTISAGRDITTMVGDDVSIVSASAKRTLRNTSNNLIATTLNAGTDIVVLTDAAANLGTATAGARIVTNAGTSIDFTQLMSGTTTSLVAGTSITGGNANAGTTLSLNANGGAIGFGLLSSGANTTITASRAITGNSATASGALTLSSGADGISATALSSGNASNLTVTASNGGNASITSAASGLDLSVNANNVSVETGSATRDVLYTAANNIVAGTTSAGRNAALNAVGTINANTTTAAANILANSTGDVSLTTSTADNLFVTTTGDATLGTASATTMIGVNAKNISGTTLSAGEDMRLIASGTASVTTATVGDDFDVSAGNAITLGNITSTGAARDDRSVIFSAPSFAIVASPADGSDIRLASNGVVNAANLDAGDDIHVDGGDFTLTGLAKTRGLGVIGSGSDILINANAVTVAMVDASDNLIVDADIFSGTNLLAGGMINVSTRGDQSLGTANATRGPINGTSTLGTISFANLVTGGDINLNAGDAIVGGSANADGSIQLTSGNGVTGDMIRSASDIFVGSDVINLGTVTSDFNSIFLNGRDITVGTAGAGLDVIVDTRKAVNSRIMLGSVTAARDIMLFGANNGLNATSLLAGDDIDVDITGNAKIVTARTTGSFNGGYGDYGYGDYGYGDWGYGDVPPYEGGYGADLSNITLNAAQAMIGTAQATDNVSLTTIAGTMANNVIADNGAILVNGGTSANIMNATAALGSVTINADTVNADTVNAATDVAISFGANATLGTVDAGNAITVNGNGDAAFSSLTSGDATTIMAGGNVIGGTAVAGALLSVMADTIDADSLVSSRDDVQASARIVDIGNVSAARDALINTKGLTNSSITLGSVSAARDITLTGGTNGITATNLTAGDDIDVVGDGMISIANALTSGSNSGYGSDLSNITLSATAATIGTAQAKDNLTLTTTGMANATSLTADRGAVNVNAGPAANIGRATATLGSVTISAGNIDAGTVSANTNANFNFGGTMTVGSVTAGNSINVSGNGPSVVISQRIVNISEAIAGFDVIIDTAGLPNSSIELGSVTAARDISLSGATNGLSAASLTAGDDIDVVGDGNVMLGAANANGTFNSGYGQVPDTSNVTITANMGSTMITAGARAKDNVTITTRDGTTANSLIADRGNILVNGGARANVAQSTATLGDVTINAATINADTVTAANDAIINAGSLATINTINAGRDIAINGASNGIDVTTLRAGDDIDINVTGNARLSTAIAADAVTITGTAASRVSASLVQAERGDLIASGADTLALDAATATLGKVQLTNNNILVGAISAGSDVSVAYNTTAMIGVNAGGAIQVGGTGNLEFTDLKSGGATTLNVGGAISGRGPVMSGLNFASTSAGAFTNTGSITAATTANIMASRVNTADVTGGTGVMLRGSDSVTAGAVTATANDVIINALTGITLGSANAGSSISLTNINNAIGTGALTAGNDVTITNGGGAVNLASASVADDLRIIGQAGVTIGAVTVRGGMDQDSDGNDVFVRTAGPITITSATTLPTALATSDVILTSTAGSINGGTLNARGAVTLNAATALTLGNATAGRNILLTGQSINATTLTAATDVDATATGAMTIGTARATGGNLSLTAAGALSAMNADAAGNTRLTSTNGGDITTGTLGSGTGDIVITSDGNATMTGNSSAGRNLNVTARNLISVGGVANGTAIDLRSTDIAVNTSSGRIGEQGRTTLAQLTNTGAGVTTIGGAGVTTGYSLSNAEAQRIFAGDIIITAARTATLPTGTQAAQTLNAAAPDVVLDALTLTGATGQTGATGGNIGATGRLRIETPGKLRTVGAVAISNLASANRFQVNAAQSIEVDAATGSVSLSGAAGALGGTIELTAPSVIAASLPAISAVAAAVDGRAVNDRLAINDNAISDIGSFSANAIIVNVSNGFFVQNSGIKEVSTFSFGDRRGITVGTGGLTINAASTATRIFVSGRQLQPNGSFITGIDFLRAQTINGTRIQLSTFPPTPFDSTSTINGCAIVTASTCLVMIDGGSLARDVVGQNDDEGGSSERNGSGNNDFVRFEFKSLDSSTFAPVIDDPVTGIGNDDLYALYDARDCSDDQNLESCAKVDVTPQ